MSVIALDFRTIGGARRHGRRAAAAIAYSAVPELSPLLIAWARVSLATGILLPIAWRRGALRSLGDHKWALFIFALVEFAIPFSAIALGAMAAFVLILVGSWLASRAGPGLVKRRMQRDVT